MFQLPPKYRENPRAVYYQDDVPGIRGITFQPDVYDMAELLCEASGYERIVDVGCGYADKLAAIATRHRYAFTGIDFGMNIDHCRRVHSSWGDWIERDFEHPFTIDADMAVLVCSDVIEHLIDPTHLLRAIAESKAGYAVISTPERNVEHGWGNMGPPPNLCHIREWTAGELNALLRDFNITPRFHGLTRGNDQGWAMGTQIVIAEVPR